MHLRISTRIRACMHSRPCLQSNSEHSRHWFFGGNMIIDGQPMPDTLFNMVKTPWKVGVRTLFLLSCPDCVFVSLAQRRLCHAQRGIKVDNESVLYVQSALSEQSWNLWRLNSADKVT